MKKSIFTILPMALLASCSSELMETADNAVNGGDVEKVSIVSHPFVFDDDTRTSLTATDKGISFAWANYDALGVFPIAPTTNNQARQALSVPADCETDAHYASFDGAGWELKKGNTYAAYCPYNGSLPAETPYTEVPIDMTGQDGTLETIGKKYDYMYAPSSFAEENVNGHTHEVVFDFQHAIAILQFKLTMPVAATWKSFTLTNMGPTKCWTTSATMNVQDGSVTSKVESSDITLALKNVTTTANNKMVTLYVAVLPTEIGNMRLTATTSDNKSCCKYFSTKKIIEAGKAYRCRESQQGWLVIEQYDGYENGYAYVDLGLSVKWATMNVGSIYDGWAGKYYAWGETKAYGEEDSSNDMNYNYNSNNSYSKSYYDLSTYKWNNSSYYISLTKYCTNSSHGTVDNKTSLDPDDDAAIQNWGGAWRMPTEEELEELINNCYWVWTNGYEYYNPNTSSIVQSLNGYIVYAAKSSSDKGQIVYNSTPSSDYSLFDSHIFLPASGYRENSTLSRRGVQGIYWSSSRSTSDEFARCILFEEEYCKKRVFTRYLGGSVRAVCE